MAQNKQMFRQESLERLSSPEQLDQMMRVVSPKSWLPLTTIGCLVVAAATWSVFGRIPITVSGQAVLIRPRNVVPLQITNEGQLLTLNIRPGDTIKKGATIGTIDLPQIRQQLRQEQNKLNQLLVQNKETNELERKALELQLQNLRKQRTDLENNLAATEDFRPIVRDRSLASIQKRKESLELSLRQAKALTPKLRQRLGIRRRLFQQQKAIIEDLVLQVEQQLYENLTKISELKAQLKENERQITEAESQNLQNINSIKQINTQIQELDVKKSQLNQQQVEKQLEKENQIREIRNNIAKLRLELSGKSKIVSQYDGRVIEVPANIGQAVSGGTRLASIDIGDPEAELMSVMYFPDKDGKQVKQGMTVQVTPSTVKRERYGGIVGKVTKITPFPVTNQDMTAVIGNENIANSIAQSISNNGGSAVQIVADLQENPQNISGFKWSSSEGPNLQISPGTTAQARVVTGELAPISYVIPLFREWTGIQ